MSSPVLKECHSYGVALPEAMESIKEAILLCLEDEQPQGIQQNHILGVRDLEIALP